MLNGKFFTGLPPKMIDRGNSGGRNRMESHLFWPDDTQKDTAIESRVKRRSSVQLACTDKPLYEKQNSAVDHVDTRKRFSKEFSQSSIQFYDNLNENNANSRRSMLRNSMANKKMEITDKPTNTKHQQLSDSIANEDYTAAKNKQAYASKIAFYDYDKEEPQYSRNNLRKPKMDMNDKREMELNSKNSPKLQVKRDVRSLSEEKELHKINNREVRAQRINTNDNHDKSERFFGNGNNYMRNTRSVEPRLSISPKRGWTKSRNNRQHDYSSEREIYREPLPLAFERRKPAYYEEPKLHESRRFVPREHEDLESNIFYQSEKQEPKRMIRNNSRQYYAGASAARDCSQEYQGEREMRDKMRDIHLRSPPSPARKEYYPAEHYYDDEPQYSYVQNDQIKTPTNRGSSHQRFNYSDREVTEAELPYKDYNNSPKSFSGNTLQVNKINNQFQKERVAPPTSPSPPSDTESSVSATKSQKHLRSSLCFNNYEIIGANDAAGSPTSSQHSAQRRNARSSATQRVSVGLPD